jgi:ABC-type taurine transport system ATPase subunit
MRRKRGFDIFLVGHVLVECLLLAERFLRLARGNQRAFINAVGKLPHAGA